MRAGGDGKAEECSDVAASLVLELEYVAGDHGRVYLFVGLGRQAAVYRVHASNVRLFLQAFVREHVARMCPCHYVGSG